MNNGKIVQKHRKLLGKKWRKLSTKKPAPTPNLQSTSQTTLNTSPAWKNSKTLNCWRPKSSTTSLSLVVWIRNSRNDTNQLRIMTSPSLSILIMLMLLMSMRRRMLLSLILISWLGMQHKIYLIRKCRQFRIVGERKCYIVGVRIGWPLLKTLYKMILSLTAKGKWKQLQVSSKVTKVHQEWLKRNQEVKISP